MMMLGLEYTMHIDLAIAIFNQFHKVLDASNLRQIFEANDNDADAISRKMFMKSIYRTPIFIVSVYEVPCDAIRGDKNSCRSML